MNLLEKNIEMLSHPRHRIAEITAENIFYTYVGQEQGEEFFIDRNENVYIIKKEIDPDFECKPLTRELIFVLGINVDEIDEVIRKSNENSTIIIYEPNPSFFMHALQKKDMTVLDRNNIIIIAEPLQSLSQTLSLLLGTFLIFLVGNVRFYATYFYRQYDLKTFYQYVQLISSTIKYKLFNFGNSIEDSLTGLSHNLKNLHHYFDSKDVSHLTNIFENVPAFIVSAGPSLDKNMHELKRVQGKALIIAVDTILRKLLLHGIVPDFVCTVERDEIVYDYFYKDTEIPPRVTLVAPSLVSPRILQKFNKRKILPMRRSVGEYIWLQSILGLDEHSYISMGISVAHLAYGFARHVGANPIVLVGQDLAYGEDTEKTHSTGTIYDQIKLPPNESQMYEVDGYYGGKVKTEKTWLEFKKWFELEFAKTDVTVINATEGGARIEHTIQMPLREVIDQYCSVPVYVQQRLNAIPNYSLDLVQLEHNIQKEINKLTQFVREAKNTQQKIERIRIHNRMSIQQLLIALEKMKETDKIFGLIMENYLLRHNLQPELINTFRKLYRLEEVLSYDTVKENHNIQMEFLNIVIKVTEKIIPLIKENVSLLKTTLSEQDYESTLVP
jgi:hypothetical protein